MLFLTFSFKQQLPALLRNKLSYSVMENGVSHGALEALPGQLSPFHSRHDATGAVTGPF